MKQIMLPVTVMIQGMCNTPRRIMIYLSASGHMTGLVNSIIIYKLSITVTCQLIHAFILVMLTCYILDILLLYI